MLAVAARFACIAAADASKNSVSCLVFLCRDVQMYMIVWVLMW